jgi:hypothetical protein
MDKRLWAVLAAAAMAVIPWLAGQAVAATCVSDPAVIASAEVAFVGQLTGVNPAGDQATLAVKEVWSAGSLPPVVVVTSATGEWLDAPDSTYLVLAKVVDGNLLIGRGECDVAYPWDASYANLRPATAHPPQGSDGDGDGDTESAGPPPEILLLIGVALVVWAVSAFAFRRTRAPVG